MTTEFPDRFDLATEPPADERLLAFRELFPEVMREDKIDVDALRRSLGNWVDAGSERFGLTWPGKAECMKVIQEPSIGTLIPMPDESIDWDTTKNVIIEGENLEVLKLLQKAYYGQVKLIYIDPPYNTGNEFIYPDRFQEGLGDYLRFSGQVDEEGLRLTANTEHDGRYHSKWLSMMYPRLYFARNLLSSGGVIFVTIDDNEHHNLVAIMHEIFGEENFVANIAWKHTQQSKNDERYFSRHHNSVLVYRRGESASAFRFGRTDTDNRAYSNPDNDPRGDWRSGDVRSPNYRETLRYEIVTPNGGRISPPDNGWRWKLDTLQEKIESGEVIFSGDEMRIIRKIYLEEQEGRTPENLWVGDFAGTTRSANAELKKLFDSPPFDTPKPTELVRRMLELVTPDGHGVVLDFFAGSGTTAHAVMAQNEADGGDRSYLLVQLPEPIDSSEYQTIAQITRERVRRAAAAISKEEPHLGATSHDLGFRSYELCASNFRLWDAEVTGVDQLSEQLRLAEDNVRDGASELSILTEILLKAGYPLTSPVDLVTFAGVPGYSVSDGALLVCLSDALTIEAFEAMVASEPAMILVLDAGFGGSDELKVNALQTVRARNQQSGSDIALRVV